PVADDFPVTAEPVVGEQLLEPVVDLAEVESDSERGVRERATTWLLLGLRGWFRRRLLTADGIGAFGDVGNFPTSLQLVPDRTRGLVVNTSTSPVFTIRQL